jgi:hypothetical protein
MAASIALDQTGDAARLADVSLPTARALWQV